jgi:hypothetical protein
MTTLTYISVSIQAFGNGEKLSIFDVLNFISQLIILLFVDVWLDFFKFWSQILPHVLLKVWFLLFTDNLSWLANLYSKIIAKTESLNSNVYHIRIKLTPSMPFIILLPKIIKILTFSVLGWMVDGINKWLSHNFVN